MVLSLFVLLDDIILLASEKVTGFAIIIVMIIGIESSCDESSLAIFDRESGVLWNDTYSQIVLHSAYGGVVPELAAREHVKTFPILVDRLMKRFKAKDIDHLAVTTEPGLPGCLAIGRAVANALSVFWKKPVVPINHLDGHLFSPFIEIHSAYGRTFKNILRTFLPHLSLLVSGGNTCLQILFPDGQVKVLAKTQDDAAGEAFDKGAKLLGFPYPGGRLIEQFARSGDPNRYHFPRAYHNVDELKFSFSGLKTSLRYFLEKEDDLSFERDKSDICASYQEAIIDALVKKVEPCITHTIKSFGICGGVSNNQALCERFREICNKHSLPFLLPKREYTGDNAAMIAFVSYIREIFP